MRRKSELLCPDPEILRCF